MHISTKTARRLCRIYGQDPDSYADYSDLRRGKSQANYWKEDFTEKDLISLLDKFSPTLSFLKDLAVSITPVGSRVTCNPPPTDTDQDWLVFIPAQNMFGLDKILINNDFILDSPSHYDPDRGSFKSWSDGENNIILTWDKSFHDKFITATNIAKEQNILKKADRIKLFQKILYENDIDGN